MFVYVLANLCLRSLFLSLGTAAGVRSAGHPPLSPSLSQTGGLSVRVDDECRRVGAHGMLWRWL